MQWITIGSRHLETECGHGRVTGLDGDYCQAHYREHAGAGQWLPVRTPTGKQAWRRTTAGAKSAVEEWLRHDR